MSAPLDWRRSFFLSFLPLFFLFILYSSSQATLLINVGGGPAVGLTMDSLQPKIVENDKGLLLSFEIVGVQVDGVQQPL